MSSLPAVLGTYLVSWALQLLEKSPITVSWFAVKILLLVCISLQALLGVNNYPITVVTLSKAQCMIGAVLEAFSLSSPIYFEMKWNTLIFFFKKNTRAVLPRTDNNQVIRTFLRYRTPGLKSLMLHFHTKNWMWISFFSGECLTSKLLIFYEGFIFCLALSMVSTEKNSKLWFSGLICWI